MIDMSEVFHTDRRSAARHWVLIFLILATAIVDVHRLGYLARYLAGTIALVSAPFTAVTGTATIETVQPAAAEAGLRPGDTLVSIDGRPYTGSATLYQSIQPARPGDVIDVRVRPASASASAAAAEAPRAIRVTLAAKRAAPTDRWFVLICIFVLLPIGSQIVGFWAVRSRAWDTQAWIVLALV